MPTSFPEAPSAPTPPRARGVVRFGMQREVREGAGVFQKLLSRTIGAVDPAHWLHFQYFKRALDGVVGFTPRRILDAGCDTGDFTFYLAQRFPEAEVIGIDIDPRRVDHCTRMAARLGLANVRFEVADVCHLPFGAGAFDLVVCIDVLEHVSAPPAALRGLAGSLRPGGAYFFHVPTARRKPVPLSRYLTAFHAWAAVEHQTDDFTPETFVALVEGAGLVPARVQRTFGWWTGELATSLFALPYHNTPINRVFQVVLILPCRLLAALDFLGQGGERYAVAVEGRR